MKPEVIFGLSVLLSFAAFGITTQLYIWPRLRTMRREDALIVSTVPHAFRFVGLAFLIPGVVSPSLAPAFANEAGYGDLVATILAIVAIGALTVRAGWALALVWFFNLWGAADLVNALYQGAVGVRVGPGSLRAAYFIPTAMVPPWLVMHGLSFRLLLRRQP